MASRGRSRQDASPQYSHAAKRKAYKDALSEESEELTDLDEDTPSWPKRPPYKRSKTHQSATRAEPEGEMDVDVETVSRSARVDDDVPPLDNGDAVNSGLDRPRTSNSKQSKKTSGGGKKRVVWSDEEDGEAAAPYKPSARTPEPENDEEKIDPAPSAKPSQSKSKPTLPRIPKKKNAERDSANIQVKDERKTKSSTSRQELRKRAPKDDQDDDYASPGSPSIEVDVTDDRPVKEPPPQSNKKKLPPIRKNKPPTEPVSKPPFNLATLVRVSPLTDDLGSRPKPNAAARNPALAAADLDLTNASVYASLFKSTGGSAPRSGINRRERDEERLKELKKQREEAKARRAQEAKVSFSLQTQQDKIARWEERFRANKSCVLFPNYIAAKFREEHEQELRREEREANGDHPDEAKTS